MVTRAHRHHKKVLSFTQQDVTLIQVQVQMMAVSAFVLARNCFTNGYLAVALGAHQFACQTHLDIRWVLSRLGLSISDTMIQDALATMANDALAKLCQHV